MLEEGQRLFTVNPQQEQDHYVRRRPTTLHRQPAFSLVIMLKRSLLMKRPSRAPAPPKFPSSSSRSTIDDDADVEPRSLFVVAAYESYEPMPQYFCGILQIEPHVNDHGSSLKTQVIPAEFSAKFSAPSVKHSDHWVFSPLVTPTKAELYIVPYSTTFKRDTCPLYCGIFDLRTETCTSIKAPLSPKYGHVATLGEHVYFMANPHVESLPLFERYNTLEGSWEVLEPIPPIPPYDKSYGGGIVATVVLDDTILLSIGGRKILAYYVPKGQWYLVKVKNKRCYRMRGEAVALKNRIYAIPDDNSDKVLELSIERLTINGRLVFTLDLRSQILVPGLKRIKFGVKLKDTIDWTEHFVHLGKDNFCLVQCCIFYNFSDYQYIQVTYIKLKGKDSAVTNRCVHKFTIPADFQQFTVKCCFSLPKSKTAVLEEGQRLFTVNLKPGAGIETPKVGRPKPVACSSVHTKLYFGPKASTLGDDVERNDTDEEGCSTCERCFRANITLRQFVEELNKYEPEGFRLMIDNIGNLSAYVKFENEAQKRESYFSSDITLGRFVKKVRNYGPNEYRLMIDNTGNFCACLDFESASYKKHVAKWKTRTESEYNCSDDSMSDVVYTDSDEDESFSESDSEELFGESDDEQLSGEETPAKVEAGKKRSCDSEPKTPAASKKVRDGKNAGTSHVATHPFKQTKKKCSSTRKKRRKHGKVACRSASTIASTHADGAERNDTNEEGRSICVRNLPLDSNFGQVLEELKKFGPIKSDELKLAMNNTGNFSAYVEYESATSKQRAIEASTINIRGFRVEIEENRKAPTHSS